MKILHTCLSCFYIDSRAYQENELTEEHKRQGHEVLILASTQVHNEAGFRDYCEPGSYYTESGIRVVRVPYENKLPKFISRKIKIYEQVLDTITEFKPDVIMMHGICAWDVNTVCNYKKINPSTKIFADTHTDFENSARGFWSKWLLHRLIYKRILLKNLHFLEKILCVSALTKNFAESFYNIPSSMLEFYPLGGYPMDDAVYSQRRSEIRTQYELSHEKIVFVQSGKQSRNKYLLECLRVFTKTTDPRFVFYIAGVLMDDTKNEILELINSDSRVRFLGWQSPENLEDLLCAADVYLQPGAQSSTMQTSICCRCAVVLTNWVSHRDYVNENGWLIDKPSDLINIFESISEDSTILESMKNKSAQFGMQKLDYATLAKRVL